MFYQKKQEAYFPYGYGIGFTIFVEKGSCIMGNGISRKSDTKKDKKNTLVSYLKKRCTELEMSEEEIEKTIQMNIKHNNLDNDMEDKKEIIITVSGATNTGKSRILYLLKSFLKENGFDVKFDGGGDFADEDTFNSHMSSNIEQVSGYIKESRTIVMREENVRG
jgi:hypothetical protein